MSAPSILYVEDDENDVFLLRHHLRAAHVAAHIAHVGTPADFLEAMQRVKPDLILADGNVPGFDTNAALEAAKVHCPGVPFYYLTGGVTEKREAAMRAAGAAGCLTKDDTDEVVSVIRRALEARRRSVDGTESK